jgi:hypothetical protein
VIWVFGRRVSRYLQQDQAELIQYNTVHTPEETLEPKHSRQEGSGREDESLGTCR